MLLCIMYMIRLWYFFGGEMCVISILGISSTTTMSGSWLKNFKLPAKLVAINQLGGMPCMSRVRYLPYPFPDDLFCVVSDV